MSRVLARNKSMKPLTLISTLFAATTLALVAAETPAAKAKAPKAPAKADDLSTVVGDGYRGIWYMNQPVKDEYRYKYSGGFGTYPQQHVPIAIYVAAQQKTFFVFGGKKFIKMVNILMHTVMQF